MIWLFLILIFILVVAATWWFGMWSNFITLINLILSALIATSFYETVAARLLDSMSTYAVLIEFVAIWITFLVPFFLIRAATDVLTAYRLKFDPITELVGRSLLSVLIALAFVCFAAFTMQMGPLPPHLFAADSANLQTAGPGDADARAHIFKNIEEFQKMIDNDRNQEALGPDKMWASTVRVLSKTGLSSSREKGLFYAADTRELVDGETPYEFQDRRVYDPLGTFFVESAIKRRMISAQEVLRIDTSGQ